LPRRLNRLPAWIGETVESLPAAQAAQLAHVHSVPTQTRNVYLRLEHLITFFLQSKAWTAWGAVVRSAGWMTYLDFGCRRRTVGPAPSMGELFALMNWCHFLQQEERARVPEL